MKKYLIVPFLCLLLIFNAWSNRDTDQNTLTYEGKGEYWTVTYQYQKKSKNSDSYHVTFSYNKEPKN